MSLSRRALLFSAVGCRALAQTALAVNPDQRSPRGAALTGYLGDSLNRNISQWLKVFDIHRHVGLIETHHGAGAGLLAGRWLEASVLATEWSGDAFLRQRASGMLDRILASQTPAGPPFPGMTRGDLAAMAGALNAAADFWQNGPAAALADRLEPFPPGGRPALDLGLALRTTETEQLSAVLPQLEEMLRRTHDAKWADALESLLWNQLLASQSTEGDAFFPSVPFDNPNGDPLLPSNSERIGSAGSLTLTRVPWLFYSSARDTVFVHQFGPSSITLPCDGGPVRLVQRTSFPAEGDIALEILASPPEFTLHLRIPGWCRTAELVVNREALTLSPMNGYVTIRRSWRPGDIVHLRLPMEAVLRPKGSGEAELWRGPVLYRTDSAGISRILPETLTSLPGPVTSLGPACQLRGIMESGREAVIRLLPFASPGRIGAYRTAFRID